MGYKVMNQQIESLLTSKISLKSGVPTAELPGVFTDLTLGAKTVYWFGRLEDEVTKRDKAFSKTRKSQLEAQCKKNADGSPEINGTQYVWLEGGERKANEAIEELLEMEVDIQIDKLKIKLVPLQGKINSHEIRLLFPFVDFIDMDDKSADLGTETKKDEKSPVEEAVV